LNESNIVSGYEGALSIGILLESMEGGSFTRDSEGRE
jgi:hypothetical protein